MNNNFDKACDMLQNMDIDFVIDNLSISVDFIRIERFKPGMGFDDHAHSNFEFHYIKSGKGKVVIGGRPYDLVPGSVYVTGTGIVHNQIASEADPMVEYAMKCSIGLVNAAFEPGMESEEGYVISILNNNPGFVVQDVSGMDTLYETLFEEASAARPGYFGQIRALIYRIILSAARSLDPSLNAQYNVPSRNLNRYRIEAARRFIVDNTGRNVTCRELSRHLFLSEKQFGRIIKAETGMTAHDFILSEKLGRVKQLLHDTDLTLHSISELTGFSSEFHLSAIFRKKVGVSPQAFKKQSREESCVDPGSRHAKASPFYPLKFRPLFKDYIWGGRNLEKLGKSLPDGKVAESWEISAHHDGMNIVSNGSFEGSTLEDLILEHGAGFVGSLSWNRHKKRFPLLLKLIDTNDRLSVQVHPDDDYSAAHENDAGKTEVWFILEAEPNAQIIYGLSEPMCRERFSLAISDGRIEEFLRYVNVSKGDMIYVPAGTIHAAGRGILIAEIQQSSNATYRLFDYDRKNPDGSSRALHIEKALDSIDFSRVTGNGHVDGLRTEPAAGLGIRYMIADPHFCTQILEVRGDASFTTGGRSFHALVLASGSAEISWEGGSFPVNSGESILIPAGISQYSIKGSATVLKSFIGDVEEDIFRPLRQAGYSDSRIKTCVAGL